MNIERLQSQSASFSQARSAAHVTEWTVGILDESYTRPAEGAVSRKKICFFKTEKRFVIVGI